LQNILDTKKKKIIGFNLLIFKTGIALSVSETIRNVFNGAETLEASVRGNIGASRDLIKQSVLTFQNMELI
jgi:hypothetical protein